MTMSQSNTNGTTTTSTSTIADKACAFNISDDQGKHYSKTEFFLLRHEVEVVSQLLSHVFYNDENNSTTTSSSSWSITPAQLREMVISNTVRQDEYLQTNNSSTSTSTASTSSSSSWISSPIYGSAIAFEPDVWTQTLGLDDGVTYPASSMACMTKNNNESSLSTTYDYDDCDVTTVNGSVSVVTTLRTNSNGMTLYSPYAFRGPNKSSSSSNESISEKKKCTLGTPEFCFSMDLARAYDYSNVTLSETEWYNAPRCRYLRDGIRSGYWTSPYFDAGAGNINMVTYSQPIISPSGKFLGVTTLDIAVDYLCYGEQCTSYSTVDYNYLTQIRPVGFTFAAISMTASLGCGIWTYTNRKDKVVLASQPFFLILICCGCFIMASSIIPLSIDDSIASVEGCSKACMAFPWLLSIGFTAIFSALTSKTWRLNRVMDNARRMKRVTVKEMDAILPFASLMTINCVIMLTWTIVDPLLWVREEPTFDDRQSYGSCTETSGTGVVFKSLIGAVNFLALVMANVQAFRARNISSEFSDAFYVMMTMISLLQTSIIGIPLLILVVEYNRAARYFIWCGLIFISTTAVIGLMFGPKIMLVRQRAKRPMDSRTSHIAQTTTVRGAQLSKMDAVNNDPSSAVLPHEIISVEAQ